MKKILFALVALAATADLAAQTLTAHSEQPRYSIRPYASVEEAVAAAGGGSRYIVPLTEWRREEVDGKTRFTTEFVYPAAWLNRQILFRTESASCGFGVEVEGSDAGSVTNGAVPAEFNITKLAKTGINRISVTLAPSSESEPLNRADVQWLGKAEIVSQPTVRVRDLDMRTTLNGSGDAIFEMAIAVKSEALNTKQASISYELCDTLNRITAGHKDVTLSMRGEDTVRFATVIPRDLMWSAGKPVLLTLTIRNRIEGRYAENIAVPVGVREVAYANDRLWVNGEPVALKAKRVAANISTEELLQLKDKGFNAVTVEAGEAPLDLYAACDSTGVYVVAQVAVDTSNGGRSIKRGGNASNDPQLTDEYLSRTSAMFHTSKFHPSVVAFSLGGGVSNGINPYESYLLLKGLDSSRPIIYEGAGTEWNNDSFDLQIVNPNR